ncbi:hypothetical protein B0H11DRAFT_2230160 [Mycena galericulata]|nr:hypothetical protein B0H11DRAFT_2230160 [Mycena galericulata]
MSTHSQDGPGRADASQHWRQPPPHLNPGATTGNTPFVSATSQAPALDDDQAQSADRTTSPDAPSGLTARLETDAHGRRFLRELDTGLRIDIVEADGSIFTGDFGIPQNPAHRTPDPSTVSDESDITPGSQPTAVSPEAMVNTLIDGIDTNTLSLNQRGMLHTIKGALTTGRTRLLNTTAVVVNQRKDTQELRSALKEFRNETAARILEFGAQLDEGADAPTALMSSFVKISAMGSTTIRTRFPNPVLPTVNNTESFPIKEALMQEIDRAVPPRQQDESTADFERRARAAADSNRRAAAAFTVNAGVDARDGQRPPIRITRTEPAKTARFEDPGSISSAPRFQTQATGGRPDSNTISFGPALSGFASAIDVGAPTPDVLEEFNQEAERTIGHIIQRQVGEPLEELPSRIRAPKLDPPTKFSGANDHVGFLSWTESTTTWMRASFMGGPGQADQYRITVLKTLLSGSALQWFIDYVETRSGQSSIPYDFTSIMCALHRRFVTAATAQKASREFDAVRYKADEGPLKLMDELVDCSSRLREPMPDFIVRQRFMNLLPESIRSVMSLHRAISAEYSTITQMRYHSNQIWEHFHSERTRSRTSGGAISVSATPGSAPPRPPIARRDGRQESHGPSHNALAVDCRSTPANPGLGGPHTDKRCFKCGAIGHIGSDKICPKNNPNPPRIGVAAQRVLDSYADEGVGADGHDAEGVQPHELVDDNWGGSQYDPEDMNVDATEPNPTDLGDLIDFSETPRVGSMQIRYFSMRIEPTLTDEEDANPGRVAEAPSESMVWDTLLTPLQSELNRLTDHDLPVEERTVASLYSFSSSFDVFRLNSGREYRGEELLDVGEAVQARRDLLLEHEYPISPQTRFEELLYAFNIHHPGDTHDEIENIELGLILALGTAVSLREQGQQVRARPPGEHMAVSTQTLWRNLDALFEESARFARNVETMREARNAARAVHTRAIDAIDELVAIIAINANPRLGQLRELIRALLENTMEDMEVVEDHFTIQIVRLRSLQSVIMEEIRRRSHRRDSSASSAGNSDADDGPPAPSESSSVSGHENEDPVLPGSDDTRPPSVSPPPSYRTNSPDGPETSHNAGSAAGNPPSPRLPTPSEELMDHPALRGTPPPDIALMSRRIVTDEERSTHLRIESVWDTAARRLIQRGPGESSTAQNPNISSAGQGSDVDRSDNDSPTSWNVNDDLTFSRASEDHDQEGYTPGEMLWIYGSGPGTEDYEAEIERCLSAGPSGPASEAEAAGSLNVPQSVPAAGSSNDDDVENSIMKDNSSGESRLSESDNNSEYDIVVPDLGHAEPSTGDELITQAVVQLMGSQAYERYLVYADTHGQLYTVVRPLPDTHYLHPGMVIAHRNAMDVAIRDCAEALNCSPRVIRTIILDNEQDRGTQNRRGYRDTPPSLMGLPVPAFIDRVASLDPEEDDEDSLPGFRVQNLSQRVEHLANVNRPDSKPLVGITDQPSRNLKDIACLTAELEIGGVKAYALFDTGSNTDSLTPDFAR